MKIKATIAAVGLASATLVMAATAQAAAPLDHSRITFPDSFSECAHDDFPGYNTVQTFSAYNLTLAANPSTEGQFFRFSFTWTATGTTTNPLTGEYVSLSGHGLYKEIQPRPQGGGFFTYVQHNVGSFVMTDSDGNVLLREAGRVTLLWEFDSLSDSAPGGNQLSATLLSVSGPHPSLTGEVDYCEVLDAAIG